MEDIMQLDLAPVFGDDGKLHLPVCYCECSESREILRSNLVSRKITAVGLKEWSFRATMVGLPEPSIVPTT
jgi:hypothetical protein